jgi:hypothetical protein
MVNQKAHGCSEVVPRSSKGETDEGAENHFNV